LKIEDGVVRKLYTRNGLFSQLPKSPKTFHAVQTNEISTQQHNMDTIFLAGEGYASTSRSPLFL
jgi:hypothetical protein